MLLGWIILGIIFLIVFFVLEMCGLPFEISLFIFLVVLLGVALYVTLWRPRLKEKNEAKEKQKLYKIIPYGKEYFIKGNLKKVVLSKEMLYIRKNIGIFYECKNIKSVRMVYKVNDEMVDYSDPYGAAKMGAVAGIASWFGISTISDLSSLDNNVLEKRLTISIEIEMKNSTLNLCAINEIVKDNSLFDQVKELVRFVNDLKSYIDNQSTTVELSTAESLLKENKNNTIKEKLIKNKKTITLKRLLLFCISLGALVFTFVSLEFGFYANSSSLWLLTLSKILKYLQLIITFIFIIIEIIGLFYFGEKNLKKIEFTLIITCLFFNVIRMVLGIVSAILVNEFNYTFLAVILNLPFTISYFICNKKMNSVGIVSFGK